MSYNYHILWFKTEGGGGRRGRGRIESNGEWGRTLESKEWVEEGEKGEMDNGENRGNSERGWEVRGERRGEETMRGDEERWKGRTEKYSERWEKK